MKYLQCYKHNEEVYKRDIKLWHIQGGVPVICDDRLFLCSGADHPFTRDGVFRRLILEDPMDVINRLKDKGASK